jgi:enoyl-CoA hydratase
VIATKIDGVLTVTVNRAGKRNALSLAVLERLRQEFSAAAADTTLRLAILTGAGDKAFASGGDLTELASHRSAESAQALSVHGGRALDAIRGFPVAVVARLNGVALGGGAELALACDLRFAAAHATLGFIHSRLAIAPSWGGGLDLVRLVGPARALRLLATAEVLDAQAAQAIGLVDGVAAAGVDFDEALARFLDAMRRQPPQVMRALKAQCRFERLRDRAPAEAEATGHFVSVWTHPDHWAAVDAVTGKATAK